MKRLLLAPLLISISLLTSGFFSKPNLRVLYCDSEQQFVNDKEDQWNWYPWAFDTKTGELFNFDKFMNEATPLLEDQVGDSSFSYRSALDGNILKIKEKETYRGGITEARYAINVKNLKAFREVYGEKTNLKCVEKTLPKNFKIKRK